MDSLSSISKTLIISDNIERLWFFFRDPSTLSLSNPSLFSPLQSTQSIPIWFLNSSFIIKCSSKSFECNCVQSDSIPFTKTIKWRIAPSSQAQPQQSFSLSITLYHVSDDDSTIIKLEMEDLTNDMQLLLSDKLDAVIKNINDYILRSNSCLYQNEGIIIETDIATAWNCVLDWENEKKLSMNSEKDVHTCDTSIFDEGAVITITKEEGTIVYKVKHVLRCEKELKWEYFLDLVSKSDYKEIRWTFIKINEEQCYLSLCHLLNKMIDNGILTNMSVLKKEYITKMKEIAEEKGKGKGKVNNGDDGNNAKI